MRSARRSARRSPEAQLVRLRLAVLVDYKTVDGKPVAHSDKELAELTSLARQAAGIDDARGDKIEVHSIPFAAEPGRVVAAPVEPALPLIPIAIAPAARWSISSSASCC